MVHCTSLHTVIFSSGSKCSRAGSTAEWRPSFHQVNIKMCIVPRDERMENRPYEIYSREAAGHPIIVVLGSEPSLDCTITPTSPPHGILLLLRPKCLKPFSLFLSSSPFDKSLIFNIIGDDLLNSFLRVSLHL